MLTAQKKKRLRTIGHKLKPVVIVAGNGLTENVIAEINRALNDHELIKIKVALEDRQDRRAITDEIQHQTGCDVVQIIGKMALVFRAAAKPNPKLTNVSGY